MNKKIKLICAGFSIIFFVWQFCLIKETFFFYDEWAYLYTIITSPIKFILSPINEHFIPIFNLSYFLEYKIFGLKYGYYQLILLTLHYLNAYLLGLIVFRLTKNWTMRIISFFLFLINSVYWEVLFSSQTLSSILYLFFIEGSVVFYMKYGKGRQTKNLLFSAIFSLFAAFSWGGGLFLPISFVLVGLVKKLAGERVKILEILTYLAVSIISAVTYLSFVKPSLLGLDFNKIVIFTLSASRWIIVSFYTVSPGKLKLFVIIGALIILIFIKTLRPGEQKKKFLARLLKEKYYLLFSIINFFGLYILVAISRYDEGAGSFKISRYTYVPLFFLILINVIIWEAIYPLLSKNIKFVLGLFLVFILIGHIYFFKIYYRNWMETISLPQKKIFEQITIVTSEKELEKMELPFSFGFLKPKDIYNIYKNSL